MFDNKTTFWDDFAWIEENKASCSECSGNVI